MVVYLNGRKWWRMGFNQNQKGFNPVKFEDSHMYHQEKMVRYAIKNTMMSGNTKGNNPQQPMFIIGAQQE